tara:strand:+ start:218 stop:394 length:177 start_codon:yes stop_codon:yes gene_type:complete
MTYQDLEQSASESKVEFDSILFQIETMEKQMMKMQMSIMKLKTYMAGSIYFEHLGETE